MAVHLRRLDRPGPGRAVLGAGPWAGAHTHDTPDEVCLEPPEGSPEDGVSPDLLFLRVPEAKSDKNRLHIDLRPDDQAAEVARLEALGATRVGGRPGRRTCPGSCWPTPTATSSACSAR